MTRTGFRLAERPGLPIRRGTTDARDTLIRPPFEELRWSNQRAVGLIGIGETGLDWFPFTRTS